MTGAQLGPFTSPDLGAARPSVLLVPLGATEQHGPHLPLDTDTRIAQAWANAIAARVSGCVVAPALAYGSSGEHQAFPGTLSIGQRAMELVLVELIRSSSVSFPAVLVVCGHGGNVAPVDRAVEQLRVEGHRVGAVFPRWSSADVEGPVDAHAGRIETSLLLHLSPDAVDLSKAAPGVTTPIAELWDELQADGVAAVTPNGVLGDPTGATAIEGAHLLADLVDRSIADLGDLLGL